MFKLIFFLIVSICIITACSNGRTEPRSNRKIENCEQEVDTTLFTNEKSAKLDEYFSKLYKIRGFNGNVLVAQDSKIIYKKSFGYADFKTHDTLNINTAFQLASVSKQFTATAIMILKEKGLLQYDDSVQRFIPEFPYRGITIKMLLTHRSGLPNYIYYTDHKLQDKSTPVSNEQLIQMLVEDKPGLYYRPGRVFDYSNTGYVILATIVSRISGLPFEDFLATRIFNPLGMDHTFVYNKSKSTLKSNCATGFVRGFRMADDNYLNGMVGDKGVFSTVEDLYKWDQGLYRGKIISAQTLDEAFEPMGRKKKARQNYGFGWRMYNLDDSTKVLYHAGWWQGFQSLLIRIPRDKTTIVVLKNREKGSMGDKEEILSILYPKIEL